MVKESQVVTIPKTYSFSDTAAAIYTHLVVLLRNPHLPPDYRLGRGLSIYIPEDCVINNSKKELSEEWHTFLVAPKQLLITMLITQMILCTYQLHYHHH